MYKLTCKVDEGSFVWYQNEHKSDLWLLIYGNKRNLTKQQFEDGLIEIASKVNDELFSSEVTNIIIQLKQLEYSTIDLVGPNAEGNINDLIKLVGNYDYEAIFGTAIERLEYSEASLKKENEEYFKQYRKQYKKQYGAFSSVTNILIGINIAVYAFNFIFGYSALQFIIGGANRSIITDILSIFFAGFTHMSIMHVGFNMLFLHSIGHALEHYLGKKQYITLYMGSMIVSGIAVLLLANPVSYTAGASGALYGLFGYFILQMLNSNVPDEYKRNVMSTFLLNLVFTFTFSGVSIAGHLGGLAFGAVYYFLKNK